MGATLSVEKRKWFISRFAEDRTPCEKCVAGDFVLVPEGEADDDLAEYEILAVELLPEMVNLQVRDDAGAESWITARRGTGVFRLNQYGQFVSVRRIPNGE